MQKKARLWPLLANAEPASPAVMPAECDGERLGAYLAVRVLLVGYPNRRPRGRRRLRLCAIGQHRVVPLGVVARGSQPRDLRGDDLPVMR